MKVCIKLKLKFSILMDRQLQAYKFYIDWYSVVNYAMP